ncbi:MAG: DNA alkylation repair protein [Deltaproteobacteria bacterium]|nr:DNA alkylation repair protein [Deltaproteobacteria bacterium]
MSAQSILKQLKSMGSKEKRDSMSKYAINVNNAFGISLVKLRQIAKQIGTNHKLALALWTTGNTEARMLACFIDDPSAVTPAQMRLAN